MATETLANSPKTSQTTGRTELSIAPELAISVRHLSKMYPLYNSPGDRLKQSLWYALPPFLRGQPKKFHQEFWALHDLSFEVKKGETIGIIGRNGSGKSTLLQILAGTLSPTQGEVRLNGRVAALLELGSGFNLEFTGRENVYLNGSIWGLTQAEIDTIFDEITAFADIGQFIDQPVKLYSSGMFVRLAFAVQAFVPKEIFVVDEALAVGDEAFQRKCMAALEKFRENGGTVLLVSHDLQAIVRQCERCLLLSQGQLLVDGPSKPVTDLYQKLLYSSPSEFEEILTDLHRHGLDSVLNQSRINREETKKPPVGRTGPQTGRNEAAQRTNESEERLLNRHQPDPEAEAVLDWLDPDMPQTNEISYGNGDARIVDYGIYNQRGEAVNVLVMGRRYKLVYQVEFYKDAYDVHFGMMLKTVDGIDVAGLNSLQDQVKFAHIPASSALQVNFSFELNVAPGTYFLNSGVGGRVGEEYLYLDRRVDLCMIRVLPCDSRETYGLAYLAPEFTYQKLPQEPIENNGK